MAFFLPEENQTISANMKACNSNFFFSHQLCSQTVPFLCSSLLAWFNKDIVYALGESTNPSVTGRLEPHTVNTQNICTDTLQVLCLVVLPSMLQEFRYPHSTSRSEEKEKPLRGSRVSSQRIIFTKSKPDAHLAIWNMSRTSLFTYRTQVCNNNHKYKVELFGCFYITSGQLKLKSISFLLCQGFTLLCKNFSLSAVFRIKGSAPGQKQEL